MVKHRNDSLVERKQSKKAVKSNRNPFFYLGGEKGYYNFSQITRVITNR
jgi:hypothetical protein